MNWHIGQEVVCVKSHKDIALIKGEVYTIEGIIKRKCCGAIYLNVGFFIPSHFKTVKCQCKLVFKKDSEIAYTRESNFAPLEYNQEAIEELLECEGIILEN